MEEAQEKKKEKYQKDSWKTGWRTRCVPGGSRGLEICQLQYSLSKAYSTLSMTGANQERAFNNNTEARKLPDGSA